MPPRFRPAALALAAGVGLAACQPIKPLPVTHPPLEFGQYGTLNLTVARIDIVPEYRSSAQPPHVEQRSPVPPAEAVQRWANQHLHATGRTGRLQVVIKDASIVEVQLPRTQGFMSNFKIDQAQRYDARLSVDLIADAPDRGYRGNATATVSRSQTVPENISLYDREQTWLDMTKLMIDELSTKLDAEARRNLSGVLR